MILRLIAGLLTAGVVTFFYLPGWIAAYKSRQVEKEKD